MQYVICPRCGEAFEKENIEKHVVTCHGRVLIQASSEGPSGA